VFGSHIEGTAMASAYPDLKSHFVEQRFCKTGCIPTCYEILLRAVGASGINFDTFQDEFDLDKDRQAPPYANNFETVAAKVRDRYSAVDFQIRSFADNHGRDKLDFITQHFSDGRPILVSLNMSEFGGPGKCHIMPLLDMSADRLQLFYGMDQGTAKAMPIKTSDLVRIHDTYPGGREIAWLRAWPGMTTA